MNRNLQKQGYLQVFAAGILWGTIGVFVTVLSDMGADSSLISLLRIGWALVIMFFLILIKCGGLQVFRVTKRVLFFTMLMGIFCQAIFNLCYSRAIQIAGVSTAAVLLYTAPIFVCIMAGMVFKETMTAQKILALFINIIGCTLTVTGGDFSTLTFALFGVLMGLLAGFFYGLSTILSKCIANQAHPYVIAFYSFLFGFAFLLVFTHPWTSSENILTFPILLVGAGCGLVATVMPYAFYMTGLAKPVETSKVPVVASVETVIAAFLGVLVFAESMGLWKSVGVGLVLFSILVMNMSLQNPKINISNNF